jgi:cellulase
MAKCPGDSCSKVDGTTLDWFCIAQHNYDAEANDWPTEIMTRSQSRQWTFKLPNDLPGGAYIVRHAVYALHNNTGPVAGTTASPQTYPVSFEIDLESSGTELPTLTGRLPGMFSYDDYEWHRDIYSDQYNNLLTKWEFPGVAVYPGGYT